MGLIEVGKLADFVELNANPLEIDPHALAKQSTVNGTWVGGERIDLDAFMNAVHAVDEAQHKAQTEAARAAHGKRPKCR